MKKSASLTLDIAALSHYRSIRYFILILFLVLPIVINAGGTDSTFIPLSMLEQNFALTDMNNVLQPTSNDFNSGIQTGKPKLLPDNMSFAEKALWGENGFFRKIGLVAPLDREERKYELKLRRTMLTAHQIGGFTTLGLMLAAVYYGQRVIDGRRDLGDVHQGLVAATIASYSLTGLLAVLSPPPFIRRDEGGTIAVHKTLAWIHVAGMIITPILGSMIGGRRHFNVINIIRIDIYFHTLFSNTTGKRRESGILHNL